MERMDCDGTSDRNTQSTSNPNNITTVNQKRKNKRKKKNKSKQPFYQNKAKESKPYKQNNFKRNSLSMAAWAENYTKAATWQMKHQIAYWKAKAVSLEYENKILHDIIKKNGLISPSTINSSESDSEPEDEEQIDNVNDSDEIEVSEEYIEFLIANAKYREDAKKEREKFRGYKSDSEDDVAGDGAVKTEQTPEQKAEELKKKYGDNWQRILSLEMFNESHFMNNVDTLNPSYWPNIPLNIKFS